jgi:UDPglucose--hexose-1-phosphate uridylyltransferase
VCIYPNDFPTFSLPPPPAIVAPTKFYDVREAAGICDVVLYHPDHNRTMADLTVAHIEKIVRLWVKRFHELAALKRIRYVFIFENKGQVIGVTISHPHGQIYAFPFVPPKIEQELRSSEEHYQTYVRCLYCDVVREEINDGRRIVFDNNSFIAFVPFFARFPFEVHIVSKRHFETMQKITESEIVDLAPMLKTLAMKYDGLFGFSLPYMMVIHPAPVNDRAFPHYHFHIEFYPPHRSADKLKYLAGCETGAGTFINDTAAEEKADELRKVSVHF